MQSFKAREKARRYAMQALYSWMMSGNDIQTIEAFYLADRNPRHFDVIYFHQLLHHISTRLEVIDSLITECIDRPFKDLSAIELTILRVATYELKYSLDVPFKVVISEAIDLGKMFGADDSYKFINSVLDNMAKILRGNEKLCEDALACADSI